jgi:hypothetical protein
MLFSPIIFSCRAFLDKIEDGSIVLTDHDLPSFLYDQKVQYNESDEVTGLFRGFLLVRVRRYSVNHLLRLQICLQVYRHIFTGPSTAMNPTHNAPKSKAKMFNLKVVTGRTIAYACVQARDCFCSFSVLLSDPSQLDLYCALDDAKVGLFAQTISP